MEQSALTELRLKLYVDLLRTIALEDPSLMDIMDEMTLGSLIADLPVWKGDDDYQLLSTSDTMDAEVPKIVRPDDARPPFSEAELLMFGAPTRRHLDTPLRSRITEEIREVLRQMTGFYRANDSALEDGDSVPDGLPHRIQELKTQLELKSQTVAMASQRIAQLIAQITKKHDVLDQKLKKAVSVTLPAHETTRNASIDLLAATIETSLVKLSLSQARADRALYGHKLSPSAGKDGASASAGKAIEAAYLSLKKDEKEMAVQGQSLDRQLQEYESLMQLVDGRRGGYRQIVNEWTKVKQETEECLKDLRRLGWTGD